MITVFDNNSKFLYELRLNRNTKEIFKIAAGDISYLFASYDLRIDGIGLGNTLNEMYEKFGKPMTVSGEYEDGYYKYTDEKEKKEYMIWFEYDDDMYNNDIKGEQLLKPNIITNIGLEVDDIRNETGY